MTTFPDKRRPRPWIGWVLWILTALGSVDVAQGLDPAKAVTQYTRDAWTTDEGLPQNTVAAVLQSRRGYLWLATQEGLVRFDGVRFRVFDKSTTPELASNLFTSLAEDAGGRIWAGTQAGLARIDGEQMSVLTVDDGLSNSLVLALAADAAGRVWIGTRGGGLDLYQDGSLRAFTTADGLPHNVVQSLAPAPDGTLWIGTRRGLAHLVDGRFEIYTTAPGLAGDSVRAIYVTPEGTVWVGTRGGVSRLEGEHFTHLTTPDGLLHDNVWALTGDARHNLWIGTNGGLNRLTESGELTGVDEARGLPNQLIRALHVDREGGLWVGTFSGGLLRLGDGVFTTFGTVEGLGHDAAATVLEDRAGNVWVGTFGGGLSRLRHGEIDVFTTADGLPSNDVWSLAEHPAGTLWIGTFGSGLVRRRDGRFETFTTSDGLSHDAVKAIEPDGEGGLWIGTGEGLSHLHDGRFILDPSTASLADRSINCLLRTRRGDLWIGTFGGGLSRLRPGSGLETYTRADGLASDTVYSLWEDAEGALWFTTQDGGLHRFRDGLFTVFSSREGLWADTLHQVLEDDLGQLWMSSNRGVFRVRKQELEALARGELGRVRSVVYGREHGLRSPEATGGSQPAGCKGRDGRLWFPTVRGVSVVDPAAAGSAPLPPVILEKVMVDNEPYPDLAGGKVAAGSERLEIQYTALSFVAPAKIRFRYRLEGYDSDWIDAGDRRVATYARIPPGDYRFRVMAASEPGMWMEAAESFAFTLESRFHETALFRGLVTVGVVLLACGLPFLRIQRLKRREEELGRRVEETVAQLKVLRGLLPICASCKRIRDEMGSWKSIEGYLRENSQAELSHSVCPDCTRKLYSAYSDKLEARQRSVEGAGTSHPEQL